MRDAHRDRIRGCTDRCGCSVARGEDTWQAAQRQDSARPRTADLLIRKHLAEYRAPKGALFQSQPSLIRQVQHWNKVARGTHQDSFRSSAKRCSNSSSYVPIAVGAAGTGAAVTTPVQTGTVTVYATVGTNSPTSDSRAAKPSSVRLRRCPPDAYCARHGRR